MTMSVCAVCATKGRHFLLERSVRLFLEQDYQGPHTLLIFNNSVVPQCLELQKGLSQTLEKGKLIQRLKIGPKTIILVNQNLDSQTGKSYTNLGAIYNDILSHIPQDCQIVTHWDDDDIFLKNHISEGVKGFQRAKDNSFRKEKWAKKAYKPEKSWFRHANGVALMGNNLEPSIFVSKEHLLEYGYSLETTEQHLQWLRPLQEKDKIFVDPKGEPTLVYNWGDVEVPTWKTSGDPSNPLNFQNYENFSGDHGDRVITPWKKEDVERYYKEVENAKCST